MTRCNVKKMCSSLVLLVMLNVGAGAEEVERAVRIVELFEANPEAGALGMDGKMLDRPHYVQAKRLLAVAKNRKT